MAQLLMEIENKYYIVSIFLPNRDINLKQSCKGFFKKDEQNCYCHGGKHYSATTNIKGDITQNKKTAMSVILLTGKYVTWKRKKSLKVSNQTIPTEGLGNFFSSLGKAAMNIGKKILNNPVREIERAASIGRAAASKTPRAMAAAPDLI